MTYNSPLEEMITQMIWKETMGLSGNAKRESLEVYLCQNAAKEIVRQIRAGRVSLLCELDERAIDAFEKRAPQGGVKKDNVLARVRLMAGRNPCPYCLEDLDEQDHPMCMEMAMRDWIGKE